MKPYINDLDESTKEHIANALWLSEYDETKIPKDILEKINREKNSNQAHGVRMGTYFDWLLQRPQSHTPSYTKRYNSLKKYCETLSPHQAYVFVSKFLGRDATQGFDAMPKVANLDFMRDHSPKPNTQVGWHFFVGSAWDEKGKEYGVECMFFRVALLPPELAKELGISEKENQAVELQLGISEAGGRHYQADPIIISGASGLIDWQLSPFSYTLGKNRIFSSKSNSLWPLNLQAWGVEKNPQDKVELSVDLSFVSGKEYLLQGDNGCMPCVDGMGTLYYSIPDLKLKSGSTITIGDKKIPLKKGTFWFDHQWGFLSGNPQSSVLRAANNMTKPGPVGWDWYMAQFSKDRQITMFAAHSNAYKDFYFQKGAQPPGMMTVDVAGKYMDENKQLHNTWGTLKITRWVKAERTPNPALYPATHTWHPNKWEFSFDKTMPSDIREFTMTSIVEGGQTNFFANGSQYNEGAVYLKDTYDNDIGRGFAEAVQYADTFENMLDMAGITNASDRKLLKQNSDNLFGRLGSMAYMLGHQKDLKAVMADAKGLEFFSKPNAKVSKTHTSRH